MNYECSQQTGDKLIKSARLRPDKQRQIIYSTSFTFGMVIPHTKRAPSVDSLGTWMDFPKGVKFWSLF